MAEGLRFVVPDGSMEAVVTDLLQKAGILIGARDKETNVGTPGLPDLVSKVQFERPQVIPALVDLGHFDVGIAGQDWCAELDVDCPQLMKIPRGRNSEGPVRIVMAVPSKNTIEHVVENLPANGTVASEYENLTKNFCQQAGRTDLKVIRWPGGTERAILYGACAVVELTDSGKRLKRNGLDIIHQVMASSTVLIANKASYASNRQLIDLLAWRIKGAWDAPRYVFIKANVPEDLLEEASRIMSGLKGPSKMEIAGQPGWWALEACVPSSEEFNISQQLFSKGVTGIIVLETKLVTGVE